MCTRAILRQFDDSAVDTHGYGTTYLQRDQELVGLSLTSRSRFPRFPPSSFRITTIEQPSQTQIAAAITELQTEVRRQAEVIQQQGNELLLLRTRPSIKTKSSLLDPEKFNGQVHKFDTWLPSIKAKLRVDGEAISDPTAQFYYVYLNLDSHVQAMVLPQLSQAEDDQTWAYTSILD